MYRPEVINTLHKVPTGRYYVNKKGEKRPVLQRVVHRRMFLTAPESFLLPRNLRIVRVSRSPAVKVLDEDGKEVWENGKVVTRKVREVTYSLSGRLETLPTYWEKTLQGKETIIAREYTRLSSKVTKFAGKSMTYDELAAFLASINVSNITMLLDDLENGEPLEKDDIWLALAPYGYVKPEYEPEEEEKPLAMAA
jgi:hypothetical protein